MGTFDTMKRKAESWAREHSDTIDAGIDRASGFVRQRAGSKHAAQVDKFQDKAHHAAERLAGKRSSNEPDMTTPLRNQPRAEEPDRPFPPQP